MQGFVNRRNMAANDQGSATWGTSGRQDQMKHLKKSSSETYKMAQSTNIPAPPPKKKKKTLTT